jgi:hypothetical protein
VTAENPRAGDESVLSSSVMKTEHIIHLFDGSAALRLPAEGEDLLDPRFAAVLARARRDAERDPEAYACDAEVPFEGE